LSLLQTQMVEVFHNQRSLKIRHKSIYKTISYRIGSIIITVTLLRFFMDSWVQISAYTLLAHSVKMGWYYVHEKLYRYIVRRFILK